MLIGVANNKGGTGKSTLALLITSLLASYENYKDQIVACDLDHEQLNFTDMVSAVNNYGEAWKRLAENYLPGPIELVDNPTRFIGTPDKICICDMPPVLLANNHSVPVVREADILIIPVRGSRASTQGAERIIQIREGRLDKTRVVINEWKKIPREEQVFEYLQDLGVPVYTLPRLESLTTNIDFDRPWFYGLRNTTLQVVVNLINEIIS